MAAACGTTVPNADTAATGPAGVPGVVDAASGFVPGSELAGADVVEAAPADESAGADTAGPSSPGQGQASGPTIQATPTDGQRGPGSTSAGGAGTGLGVTASTITIGALTANKAGEYQSQLGVPEGSGATGDQIAMTNSVVNWLNKRGGIGGRKVKVIFYDMKPEAVAADPSSAYEAACTHFSQDNKVFAVASLLPLVPVNFYECLRKAGVVVVAANDPRSSRFMREFAGTLYEPTTPNYTRMLAQSVDALWADGWLTASSKVGVVGYDTIDARATVTDGLVPALKRHGLALTAELYTTEDGSGGASAYSGGVLQFKDKDVDRIFFAPGGQPFYFIFAADQQLYYPFYEISTLEYPSSIAATFASRPKVLAGSAGLGWSPYFDLGYQGAAKVATPAKGDCLEAVRDANQDLTKGTTFAIATWICDEWFFLRDVIARTPVIDRMHFHAAAEGLGRSFRAASTFQTYFAPNRTSDGTAAYRLNKYSDACGCYQYASPIRPMP
jgi:hypothetical protein